MFHKFRHYLSAKRQRKWQIDGMSKMVEETIRDAYILMDEHKMNYYSIKGYVRHLPIMGFEYGYPKVIYVKTALCFLKMWQYSIAMGLIERTHSFMDFMGKDLEFEGDGQYKKTYTLPNGKQASWEEASKPLKSLIEHLLSYCNNA